MVTMSTEEKLNDLAARVLSIQATDEKGMGKILELLQDLSAPDSFSPRIIKLLEEARSAVRALLEGKAEDPGRALEHLGRLVSKLQSALAAADRASQPAAAEAEPEAVQPVAPGEPVAPASGAPFEESAPHAEAASASTLLDEDPSLVAEFVSESLDHIQKAEEALLRLESDPEDQEAINTVFRAFHTIKGTTGFLGLDRVQELAHKAENLLDRARKGQIRIRGGYADLALESGDMLKSMISGLRGRRAGEVPVPPHGYDELLARLIDPEAGGCSDEEAEVPGAVPRLGDILAAEGKITREEIEAVARQQLGRPLGEALVQSGALSAADVAKALRAQKKLAGAGAVEDTVRVCTERLDTLMNMVGELVVSQSMVSQDPYVVQRTTSRLARNVAHSGKIVRELQDLTMTLRMVPLKPTFQKMARLTRDLARKSGKEIRFTADGEDTEIDRNMVEALNDPLVHMIRNSVDHGIEAREERESAGKPGEGAISLNAHHSAGSVVIKLSDDGRGLDREKILAKGIDRGMVAPGSDLTDEEVLTLIFQPGFSTADKVTGVSGRGVGMDVVRKAIEALRGRVEVASEPGRGTTFTLYLPLTMAIIDAMLVRVGREDYLIPIVSIEESFRPEPGTVSSVTGRLEIVSLRNMLIPMLRLHRLFDVAGAVSCPYQALLVTLAAEGRRLALMVDAVLGQQQIVIKSLGKGLRDVEGIAGGAILGDGRVGLILDVAGLTRLAAREEERAADRAAAPPAPEEPGVPEMALAV